jgi:hypothetical protein
MLVTCSRRIASTITCAIASALSLVSLTTPAWAQDTGYPPSTNFLTPALPGMPFPSPAGAWGVWFDDFVTPFAVETFGTVEGNPVFDSGQWGTGDPKSAEAFGAALARMPEDYDAGDYTVFYQRPAITAQPVVMFNALSGSEATPLSFIYSVRFKVQGGTLGNAGWWIGLVPSYASGGSLDLFEDQSAGLLSPGGLLISRAAGSSQPVKLTVSLMDSTGSGTPWVAEDLIAANGTQTGVYITITAAYTDTDNTLRVYLNGNTTPVIIETRPTVDSSCSFTGGTSCTGAIPIFGVKANSDSPTTSGPRHQYVIDYVYFAHKTLRQ